MALHSVPPHLSPLGLKPLDPVLASDLDFTLQCPPDILTKLCSLSKDECYVSSSPGVSDQTPQDPPTQSCCLGPNMLDSMELSLMISTQFCHLLALGY